tara:strand:+ start:168 stop:1145 length:978 start_codon:yes stop_codon:yes gene_type:complete
MLSFDRSIFFPRSNKIDLKELLILINTSIIKKEINSNFDILDISSPVYPKNNSIIFLKEFSKEYNFKKKDILIIVSNEKIFNQIKISNKILIKDFEKTYNLIINHMFIHEDHHSFKDEFNDIDGSYISKFSNIDNSSYIGKNCVIGRGVKIGKNCIIKNNVTVKNTYINDNVIICDNSVIGGTGFGFDLKNMGARNLTPQIGIVFVDSNVLIGSCCTVDRGKIDQTFIGENSMIDNQVHIAHNVVLGKNSCIAAQTGISGSTFIDDNVVIGGQTGIAGHINIGKNVIIAAKSGVTKNIFNNSVIAGFPASDIKEWKKNIIKLKKL